jgi:hypothetical protein
MGDKPAAGTGAGRTGDDSGGLEARMAGVTATAGLRAGAAAVAVGLAAGIVAVACEGKASRPVGAAAAHGQTGPGVTATTAALSLQYTLYTHCGISEARISGRYYQAIHPLSDGSGNPPAGWGNPYQAGTMTLVSGTEAVFTDKAGHRVVFAVRPGARAFLHVCS